MTIDQGGGVGIGTNNPDVKLHIVGSGGVQAKLQATNVTQSMGYIGAGDDIAYAGTLSNHPYALITNNLQRMVIGTGGNVGIGTGSPSVKLDVNGVITSNRTSAGTFVTSGDGAYSFGSDTKQYIYGTPGNNGVICAYTTNSAGTSGERIRINGDGNVGIGTDSPATKLAVNGTTSISGITTLSSTAVSTSTSSGALQVAGGVGIGGALYVGSVSVFNDNATVNGSVQATGQVYCGYGAAPSASNSAAGLCATFSNVNVGIYVVAAAAAAPSFTAPKGSLCINTTATAAGNRLYINKDGSTSWAAIPAAS
jgi:hypothetical protein